MKKFLTCLLVGFVCLVTLSAQTHEKKIYNDGVIDYVPAGAKIRLIPIDTELDIEKILYRLDSGPETEFTDLIPLVEEGRHVITYYSVDVLGNNHKDKVYSVILDVTPAEVTYSVDGPLYTDENGAVYFNKDTKFYLTAEDALSGVDTVYAALDGEEFAPVGEQGLAYVMAEEALDGEFTMLAYAVDNVGNVSPVASKTYYRDTKGPEVTIAPAETLLDKEGVLYTNKNNTFSISASDEYTGVSGLFVSVDGSPWTAYETPVRVDTVGDHSIKAYAVDGLGNASEPVEMIVRLAVAVPDSGLEIVFEDGETVSVPSAESTSVPEDTQASAASTSVQAGATSEMPYTVPVTDTATVPADSVNLRK